jgi:hypothetical protein
MSVLLSAGQVLRIPTQTNSAPRSWTRARRNSCSKSVEKELKSNRSAAAMCTAHGVRHGSRAEAE